MSEIKYILGSAVSLLNADRFWGVRDNGSLNINISFDITFKWIVFESIGMEEFQTVDK